MANSLKDRMSQREAALRTNSKQDNTINQNKNQEKSKTKPQILVLQQKERKGINKI